MATGIELLPAASPRESTRDPLQDIDELRALLLSAEQAQLAHLHERLENLHLRTQDVAGVLAEAIAARSPEGPALAAALTPSVEKGIANSIRRDSKVLSDTLFPIMGPAIRKAITAALQAMIQSPNQTMDHTFSTKGLKWRIQALRTGKPFAEIVLLNTLLFRVEQVFLIHRRTGLLLQHVAAIGATVQDTDMVSGMLTAIQDFVRDSFSSGESDSIETLHVGELTVWVDHGPLAMVAGVIRGTAPQDLREKFRQAVERIHATQGALLEEFDGETAPFDLSRQYLEECLQARYATDTAAESKKKKPLSIPLLVTATLVIAALAVLTYRHLEEKQRREQLTQHRDQLLEQLQHEPGIVVLRAAERDGVFHVEGLRDPLARDPSAWSRPDNAGEVRFAWQPYQSLEPELVLRHAHVILTPPAGVALSMDGNTLRLQGVASYSRNKRARWAARLIPGVGLVDDSELLETR